MKYARIRLRIAKSMIRMNLSLYNNKIYDFAYFKFFNSFPEYIKILKHSGRTVFKSGNYN